MVHLIDKDALAAEIERRLNYRVESLKAINDGTYWKEGQSEDEFNKSLTRCAYNAVKNEVFELMCFLDTLEVKEVDLKEEFYDFLDTLIGKDNGHLSEDELFRIAEYFFELGLSVSNKAMKGE